MLRKKDQHKRLEEEESAFRTEGDRDRKLRTEWTSVHEKVARREGLKKRNGKKPLIRKISMFKKPRGSWRERFREKSANVSATCH